MANEGSTKPMYSELEAENLRVRGLLQRMVELLDECEDSESWRVKVGQWRASLSAPDANCYTLPKGDCIGGPCMHDAESADIGKEMKIRSEIYRAARLLGAQSDLLCLLGSWGNTLPDGDILDYLKRWNDITEAELEQKAGTE